jgi:hypothetical protein
MPDIIPLKGRKAAPKAQRSTMETLIITPDQVNAWRIPSWQRPVTVNAKVEEIAAEMREDGVAITGQLTLGKLTGDTAYYVVDGQHRIEAFRLSGMSEIIADIRVVHFDTMAEMADEFVKLNSAIKKISPDDLLRGLAPNIPNLQRIMRECPFVGYAHARRKANSGSLVNLATLLRCWQASYSEVPNNSNSGRTITQIATDMDNESAGNLIKVLNVMVNAWGRDPEYYKLWGNLNLTICLWLYRRLVLDTVRKGSARVIIMTETQFKQCLMALSADSHYVMWLQGRLLNDRDRSPALQRIKTIWSRRLIEGGTPKPNLPSPNWASK